MSTMVDQCRICGSAGEQHGYQISEMMFGSGEPFRYFQCSACDCLQIAEIPDDISRHYPPDYYAYARHPDRLTGFRRVMRRIRNRYAFTRRGVVGRALAAYSPYPHAGVHNWLGRNGLNHDSRILDVGCGAGELLHDLSVQGYRNLLGVDPFIETDLRYDTGVQLRKASIHEIDGTFELIMFHHALEHVADQLETLRSVARLLDPAGECLIRIPIVSSFAWEHYREFWVQADAPRHFFLHSVRSIRLLGEQAGLKLVKTEYDSTELQFAGSELYRKGIPLTALQGNYRKRELRAFRHRADALNRQEQGDSAAFYFQKA